MVSHQALPRTRLSNSYLIHKSEEIHQRNTDLHLYDDDTSLYVAADPDDLRPPCPLNQAMDEPQRPNFILYKEKRAMSRTINQPTGF